VLVQVGADQDAVVAVVQDPVALDPRAVAAAEDDAVAERAPLEAQPGREAVVVALDVVADDVDLAERRQQLGVEGVGDDPGPVEPPGGPDDLGVDAVVLLLLRFRETSTRTLLQRLRGPPAGLKTSHTQSCCCQFGRHRSPWP
jgi:hypothetical protein